MKRGVVAIITKGKPTKETLGEILAPYGQKPTKDTSNSELIFRSMREWFIRMYFVHMGFLYESLNTNADLKKISDAMCRDGSLFLSMNPTGDTWKAVGEYFAKNCPELWDEGAQDYGYYVNQNAKWNQFDIGSVHVVIAINKNANNDYIMTGKTKIFNWRVAEKYPDCQYIAVDGARVKDIEFKRSIVPYEIITKDGKWHTLISEDVIRGDHIASKEEMRQLREAFEKSVIENADEDDFLTIVEYSLAQVDIKSWQ